MRPLRLIMKGFGPYAGTETIDFTEMGNRTMFVISGKTGAGKTTIFDGISFAIYGKASGEDRSGQEMRSHFANEDLLTEVSLQFQLRGKIYEIQRSPQQERKKKTGEGVTTITAKAELHELNEEGNRILLGSNVREVDEKIKEIIGLDANQFRQILMIPQGEFRKLLVSESKDKEGILQKLFHTKFYKLVEDKLKEKSSILKKDAEHLQDSINMQMDRIKVDFSDDLRHELELEISNVQKVTTHLTEELECSNKFIESLNKKISDSEGRTDALKKQIFEAEEILNKMNDLDRLLSQQRILEARKEEIFHLKNRIKRAQKAGHLAIVEQNYMKVGEQCKRIESDLANQKAIQAELENSFNQSELDFKNEDAKKPLRDEATSRFIKLEQLKDQVFSLSELKHSVGDLLKQQNQILNQNKVVETQINVLSQDETICKTKLLQYEDIERKLIDSEKNVEKFSLLAQKIEKWIQSSKEANDADNERVKLENLFNAKLTSFQDMKHTVEHLDDQWNSSIAAVLASSLKEEQPCMVCGSTHHPHPALSKQDLPSEAELKEAKQQLVNSEAAKTDAERKLYQAKSILASKQEVLKERQLELQQYQDINLDNMSDEYNAAHSHAQFWESEVLRFNGQKKEVLFLKEQLEDITKRIEKLKQQLDEGFQEERKVSLIYTEKQTQLNGLLASIPVEVREVKAFEAELKEAEKNKAALEQGLDRKRTMYQEAKQAFLAGKGKVDSLCERFEELKNELMVVRKAFKDEMDQLGFETYTQYIESKMTDSVVASNEALIEDFETNMYKVNGLVHELQLKLNNVEKPDLPILNQNLQQMLEQLDTDRRALSERKSVHLSNEEIQSNMDALSEKLKMVEEEYKTIGHLYEITKGQNPFRITFERYVLASFLDDILVEANLRLMKMTSGRFQLYRKVDPTRRNVQSGLELSVYDQYTGTERHVKTLSGGEGFKASLALALGLAAVVQQYSGGVSLETMFIDEGFGTLDPESLEQAIEALMDIQSSGRLVGIISHVPELKERIDARLEVVSTQSGSRTQFIFTN
ncbi:AAA family ATPase [Peribacillus alkalitolerans]|uniref:AAA family ATPase n=1 Tax=Peribacillus alkalitolerans TaxID=1550385 RepID=UPI0013D611A9|nr:SMC family ATPase [Peribacillus alkalitolerans]